MGMYDEAISEFQNALNKGYLGYAYGISGRKAEARKTLAVLLEASKQRYVSPLDIAMIYIGLNDRDRAMACLEKAYEEHATYLLFLKVDPVYSGLLSDPRFQDLLRRTNLQ
jgi:tetratricopeptide (TPR) repeat protein